MIVHIAALMLLAISPALAGEETSSIRHRFLAVDESRKFLRYVDENDRSNDWSVAGNFRDIQLVGGHRVALSDGAGVSVVDMKTRAVVETVHPARARDAQSFRWMADGRLLIVAGGGVVEVAPSGVVTGPVRRTLGARVCRTTADGGWVSGVGAELVDLAPDGTVRAKFAVPDIKHFYHVAKRADGGYYGACGYSGCAVSLDAGGKVLQRFDHPAKHFFGGLQVLTNGNLVVANWPGHGKDDVRNAGKGPQIVEFSPYGKAVWTFYDPERLGSIHHAIVLDGLDTALPYEEVGGLLVPMKVAGPFKAPVLIEPAQPNEPPRPEPPPPVPMVVPSLFE